MSRRRRYGQLWNLLSISPVPKNLPALPEDIRKQVVEHTQAAFMPGTSLEVFREIGALHSCKVVENFHIGFKLDHPLKSVILYPRPSWDQTYSIIEDEVVVPSMTQIRIRWVDPPEQVIDLLMAFDVYAGAIVDVNKAISWLNKRRATAAQAVEVWPKALTVATCEHVGWNKVDATPHPKRKTSRPLPLTDEDRDMFRRATEAIAKIRAFGGL
jgi:hypothetical protein